MDLQTEISKIVGQAAQQIAALFREHLTSSLAIGNVAGKSDGRRAKAGRPSGAEPKAPRRGKGAKRPQEEIAALAEKVGAFIRKNPGLRIEQINKELGTSTKDLALPLKKLIADKAISTRGKKRATTYSARK